MCTRCVVEHIECKECIDFIACIVERIECKEGIECIVCIVCIVECIECIEWVSWDVLCKLPISLCRFSHCQHSKNK